MTATCGRTENMTGILIDASTLVTGVVVASVTIDGAAAVPLGVAAAGVVVIIRLTYRWTRLEDAVEKVGDRIGRLEKLIEGRPCISGRPCGWETSEGGTTKDTKDTKGPI